MIKINWYHLKKITLKFKANKKALKALKKQKLKVDINNHKDKLDKDRHNIYRNIFKKRDLEWKNDRQKEKLNKK